MLEVLRLVLTNQNAIFQCAIATLKFAYYIDSRMQHRSCHLNHRMLSCRGTNCCLGVSFFVFSNFKLFYFRHRFTERFIACHWWLEGREERLLKTLQHSPVKNLFRLRPQVGIASDLISQRNVGKSQSKFDSTKSFEAFLNLF